MAENNEIIDHPDYYRLPDGRDLEDYIADARLDFILGSALKYMWRAGKKHGESRDKDLAKADHYIKFKARRCGCDESLVIADLSARLKWLESGKPREADLEPPALDLTP